VTKGTEKSAKRKKRSSTSQEGKIKLSQKGESLSWSRGITKKETSVTLCKPEGGKGTGSKKTVAEKINLTPRSGGMLMKKKRKKWAAHRKKRFYFLTGVTNSRKRGTLQGKKGRSNAR